MSEGTSANATAPPGAASSTGTAPPAQTNTTSEVGEKRRLTLEERKRTWCKPEGFVRIPKAEKKRLRLEKAAARKSEGRKRRKAEIKQLRKERVEGGEVDPASLPNRKISRYRRQHMERELAEIRAKNPPANTIVFDASYMENDQWETRSLAKQFNFIYARNRFHERPLKTLVTSCKDGILESLSHRKFESWTDFPHDANNVLDIYPKEKLIQLSDEAEEVMTDLDPEKIYVIGGIVDRSTKKGLTIEKSREVGLRAQRLPIKENIEFTGRETLNVNTVFNILLNFQEHRDWKKALSEEIPLRKQPGRHAPKGKQARRKKKAELYAAKEAAESDSPAPKSYNNDEADSSKS